MSKIIEVKNNRPRIYTMNDVTLQPGLNKLSQEQVDKFMEHPHAAIKIERGFIEVRGAAAKPAANKNAGGESTGTTGGDAPTAAELIAIIEQTEDRELLANAAKDPRVTVKRAVEARLAELDEQAAGSGGNAE